MVAEWISSSTAGADEGDAEQVAVVLVDEHAGAAGAAVGVQAGPEHRLAGVDVDHADAVPGAFGLVGGEPDGPGGRVAEEHLRHGVVVGGDGLGPHGAGSMACPAARGTTRNRRPPAALNAPGPAACSMTTRVSSTREAMLSLRKAWRRWWATVWVLMYMRAATWLLFSPSATRPATVCSVSVRLSHPVAGLAGAGLQWRRRTPRCRSRRRMRA